MSIGLHTRPPGPGRSVHGTQPRERVPSSCCLSRQQQLALNSDRSSPSTDAGAATGGEPTRARFAAPARPHVSRYTQQQNPFSVLSDIGRCTGQSNSLEQELRSVSWSKRHARSSYWFLKKFSSARRLRLIIIPPDRSFGHLALELN